MNKYTILALSVIVAAFLAWFFVIDDGQETKEPPASNPVSVPTSQMHDKNIVVLPDVRPMPNDKALLKLVDKNANNRVTADMSSRYQKVTDQKDIEALAYVLLDVTDEDTIRHEIANLLRRSDYEHLTRDLIRVLNNPKEQERFRNFAVQHLYLNYVSADKEEKQLLKQTLEDCLDDRHPAVQREGLLALHRIGDLSVTPIAKKWLHGENGELHDIAIRVLREREVKSILPELRALSTQTENETVAIAAIVTLGEWQDTESEQSLAKLEKTGSKRLQRACSLALKRIRGELHVTK